jgi:uncharacterized protein YigA (DUF484 family)
MLEVATASINTFGSESPKADFVPHSDQLISLTYAQLQDLIREATEPLREELQDLKEEITQNRAEFDRFKATHKAFAVQTTNDIDQLFEAMIKKPQPLQKDRAEILRALVVANGGKMLAKDARKKMRLSRDRFSKLLKICDFIETKPYRLDKRQDVIILKSEFVS